MDTLVTDTIENVEDMVENMEDMDILIIIDFYTLIFLFKLWNLLKKLMTVRICLLRLFIEI